MILALALAFAPMPAPAQKAPSDPAPFFENWAEDAERMMRDLMREIQPEMQEFWAEMLPRLQQLGEMMGGISNYEMPEVLENGDIIIRRKPDAPPLPQDFTPGNDPIDL